MARSYRAGVVKDQPTEKKRLKRLFNKRIRKMTEIQSGSSFKKVSCSYDLCDYSLYAGDSVSYKTYRK